MLSEIGDGGLRALGCPHPIAWRVSPKRRLITEPEVWAFPIDQPSDLDPERCLGHGVGQVRLWAGSLQAILQFIQRATERGVADDQVGSFFFR
jgi:hypothetical protein